MSPKINRHVLTNVYIFLRQIPKLSFEDKVHQYEIVS